MLNPTTVTDRYWLREVLPVDEVNNPGKWLLFFPPDRVDDGWEEIRQMFLDGELPGVIQVKVSTAKPSNRKSGTDYVGCLHCNHSSDDRGIKDIGRAILERTGYVEKPYIYYKSDEQTEAGTRATRGRKSVNHLYKLPTVTLYNADFGFV